MAPEQYDGVATEASDQYAFCLTLVEGRVGRFPLAHDRRAALRRAKLHRELVPGVVERLPSRLRATIVPPIASTFRRTIHSPMPKCDAESLWPSAVDPAMPL
jgi:hypothetical protein